MARRRHMLESGTLGVSEKKKMAWSRSRVCMLSRGSTIRWRSSPTPPAQHFEGGKSDPAFRTKPQIALKLVERAVEMEIPFRAVLGDILYGEHRKLKEGLEDRQIPYVLALKPSHTWWHQA